MSAFVTPNPGESGMQIAAVQVLENHVHNVGSPETIPALVLIVPCAFQLFEVIFHALIISARFGVARLVNTQFRGVICRF